MMATWKRLTSADREEVDVNMEQVAYMRRYGNKNQTTLYFVGGMSDKPMIIWVKETPDAIHMVEAQRSLIA